MESSDDAIIGQTLGGTIISWNKGAELLYGYPAEEVMGQPIALLLPPDRQDELPGILSRIRVGDKVPQFETVRVHKDGGLIDVALTVSPIQNAAGEVVGAATIARDISERRQAEATLRDNEERFRTAFEYAPFGMCLSALNGHLLQVNTTLCHLLGYTEQELLARGWQELTHPDDLNRSRQAAEQLQRHLAPYVEFDKRYLHRQGHAIWARVKIAIVGNSRGDSSHCITHIEEI